MKESRVKTPVHLLNALSRLNPAALTFCTPGHNLARPLPALSRRSLRRVAC
ncbi:MAG: hypothetical protein ACM3XM_06965 [Mycobacterium leprae]